MAKIDPQINPEFTSSTSAFQLEMHSTIFKLMPVIEGKRHKLIEALKLYTSAYPTEKNTAEKILTLLTDVERCYHRDCYSPGHITASSWLVNSRHTHVLLTHHKKLNKWLQLGGHTDGNEDTLQSATREAQEESGILDFTPQSSDIFDIDVHTIPARGDEPEHDHFDIRYAFSCNGDERYSISDESHAIEWVPIHDLETYTKETSMLRMAAKWKSIP